MQICFAYSSAPSGGYSLAHDKYNYLKSWKVTCPEPVLSHSAIKSITSESVGGNGRNWARTGLISWWVMN